ncbi:MAG: D-xylose transport system permease protein [Thermoanaerobaculia bacterium]|jgi:D-xylose transport system permease protein|nr:D-xylose transport system permease protein [Thermoanaerobaculia bacterium]
MTTGQHDDNISSADPDRKRFGVSTSALRAYTMLFALIVIWIYFQFRTVSPIYPYGLFLHPVNLANLLKQMSVTGVLAVGMLFVIVARQIDLSVGSLVGLAGGIAAMSQGWGLAPSLLAAIVIGIVAGALQGTLVAYANIPSFIVTLGGLLTWRGVILYLSKGETVPVRLPVFRLLGVALITPMSGLVLAGIAIVAVVWLTLRRNRARRRHGLPVPGPISTAARMIVPSVLVIVFIVMMNMQGGVPLPVIILLTVAIAGHFLTQHTTFGRYLYAIGSNPDAARLSGINGRRHILLAFALLGALVGIASLLHTGRVGSASPDAGTLMELDAIAACVIGGTSLMGGRGKVAGALLGALIMASLDNGMSLLSVENATQYIIKGAVLVAAVGFDMAGRKKS